MTEDLNGQTFRHVTIFSIENVTKPIANINIVI